MPKLKSGEMQIAFNDVIHGGSTVVIYRDLDDGEKTIVEAVIRTNGHKVGHNMLLESGYVARPAKDLKNKEGVDVASVVDENSDEVMIYDYYKLIRIDKRERKKINASDKQSMQKV